MNRGRAACILAIALTCALTAGCGRQPAQASDGSPSADTQQLPFAAQKDGIPPTAPLTSASLPAGTPIIVRLQSAISSATAQAGDSFAALLDEPIVIEEQTIVPRGATVTGRIVAAKSSSRLEDPGYLRLTLATIEINGKALPVKASSIFVKGGAHEKRNLGMIGSAAAGATGKKDVGFSPERRLTFRLAQPLPLRG